MKRPSYRSALEWICFNDCSDWRKCYDKVGELSSRVTVKLIADLFGKTDEEVAKAIIAYDKKL